MRNSIDKMKKQVVLLRITVRESRIIALLKVKLWLINIFYQRHKRYFLLNTPKHGNLGDQAISVAESKLLKDYGIHFFEFDHDECKLGLRQIKSIVRENDVILIQGGGYIGDIWSDDEDVFLDIVNNFYTNRIIVFPCSVFFREKGYALEQFVEAISHAEEFTLFAREKNTVNLMCDLGLEQKCQLSPDIVTYLSFSEQFPRERKAMFCLRADTEQVPHDIDVQFIRENCINGGFSVIVDDTVIQKRVTRATRKRELKRKLHHFSKCSFVVTDRLHGMLFSAITATPCIAFDNCSGKVSASYPWINNLGYIVLESELKLPDKLSLFQQGSNYRYGNHRLTPFFQKIIDAIKK